MNKIYCYARVSTEEQNLDRQIVSFKDFEPYTLYTDKLQDEFKDTFNKLTYLKSDLISKKFKLIF